MLNLKHSLIIITILSFLAACGGGGGSGNEVTPPAAPSQVTAVSETNAINISWKDNSNNETGFVIYREELNPATLQVQAFTVLTEKPANSTSHRDTISTEDINKTFRYAVSAKNSKGENPTDLSKTTTTAVQASPPLGSFRLTIINSASGAGTTTSSPEGINCDEEGGNGCSFVFTENTNVTLTVSPAEDSEFTGWNDVEGCNGTGTCTVIMDKTRTINIALVRTKATIAVTKSGTGLGVIRDLPSSTEINCGSDCSASGPASGYTLVLEAIADASTESIFAGWQGCPTVEGADGRFCRVTQTGPGIVTVDAIFNLPPPLVNRFEATPAKVIAGQEATLFWGVRTLGNTDVSLSLSSQTEAQETPQVIDISGKELIDSLIVNPTETTTYTLVANSASGSSTEAVAIVSIGDATTISFTAIDDPDDGTPTVIDITAADSVTLNWTLAGEAPLSSVLTKTIGTTTTTLTTSTLLTDTFSDVTGATATYTLTVTNGLGGTSSESLTVLVGDAPSISTFVIEGGDDTVTSGSSVKLNWTIPAPAALTAISLRENATAIPLAVAARTVTRTLTSPTDTPTTYSYTLIASNAFGSSAPSVLTVQAGNPVDLTSFSAPETVIALGEALPLSWVVAGSEPISFSLSRTPPFATSPAIPTGARSFTNTPAAAGNFSYTLTASNAFGAPQSLSFEVKVEPVIITDFKAATDEVAQGSPVNLSWGIRGNVTAYTLTRSDGINIVNIPENGTLLTTARAYPDVPPAAGTYTYALSATNALFGTFLADPITVVVQGPAPVVAP